jgi:hypothetical protein
MITCHKSHLSARCRERGYTLDEVMPCVVSQDGDQWTVDVDHPAYPRAAKEKPTQADSPEPTAAAPNGGPGPELKGDRTSASKGLMRLLGGWSSRLGQGSCRLCVLPQNRR